MDWANPGILGSYAEFKEGTSEPLVAGHDRSASTAEVAKKRLLIERLQVRVVVANKMAYLAGCGVVWYGVVWSFLSGL